jgi:hypothetical protein
MPTKNMLAAKSNPEVILFKFNSPRRFCNCAKQRTAPQIFNVCGLTLDD